MFIRMEEKVLLYRISNVIKLDMNCCIDDKFIKVSFLFQNTS